MTPIESQVRYHFPPFAKPRRPGRRNIVAHTAISAMFSRTRTNVVIGVVTSCERECVEQLVEPGHARHAHTVRPREPARVARGQDAATEALPRGLAQPRV